MTDRGITPSQTVGPFFAISLTPGDGSGFPALTGNDLRADGVVGEPIRIEGRVFDGAGEPVTDAMIEIWQADGAGRYPGGEPRTNTGFSGFGRAATGAGGTFGFATVKPGPVAGPGGKPQAPHINVGVFARGMLKRLFTRIYFADEKANAADPILALVPAGRRPTLMAQRTPDGVYTFDIRLQGEQETVFFEA